MKLALGVALVTLVVLGVVLVAAVRAGALPWERTRRQPGRLARRVSEADQVRPDQFTDDFVDAQAAVWEHTSMPAHAEPDDVRASHQASSEEGAADVHRGPSNDRSSHRRRYSAARARISGRGERDDLDADAGVRRPATTPDDASRGRSPAATSAGFAPADPWFDVEEPGGQPVREIPTFRPAVVESLSDPEPEPVAPAVTTLARRTSKASPAAERAWSMSTERAPRPVGRSRRSPDQVRANLASYRSGLRKGRDPAVGED